MNSKRSELLAPGISECSRKRLAENAIVTVDVCSCGVIQLHLGALTLRMEPCAVSELVRTLDRAMQKHAALSLSPPKLRGQA